MATQRERAMREAHKSKPAGGEVRAGAGGLAPDAVAARPPAGSPPGTALADPMGGGPPEAAGAMRDEPAVPDDPGVPAGTAGSGLGSPAEAQAPAGPGLPGVRGLLAADTAGLLAADTAG